MKQAKAIAWDYVKQYTQGIDGVKYNESELRVDFPNGARYRLYGADNPDSLRGLYFDQVTEDEPADMRVGFHTTIILPALSDRRGRATKIGTPKGHNEFYDDYILGLDDPNTFVSMYKASETGILAEEELAHLKRVMSIDMYAQEMECSFEASVQGAYYARQMAQAQEEGRITNVPHDPAAAVNVFFDLGLNDATSMWFVQPDRFGVDRVIRYYENSGESLSHYVGILNDLKGKGYLYDEIVMPHDADNGNYQTGQTVADKMRDYGYPVTVLPRTNDLLGDIELVRTTIPKVAFDKENCKDGIEALKQYRKQYDDKRQVFRDKPYHDWTSHAADAFRYYAQWKKTNSTSVVPMINIDTSWVT